MSNKSRGCTSSTQNPKKRDQKYEMKKDEKQFIMEEDKLYQVNQKLVNYILNQYCDYRSYSPLRRLGYKAYLSGIINIIGNFLNTYGFSSACSDECDISDDQFLTMYLGRTTFSKKELSAILLEKELISEV